MVFKQVKAMSRRFQFSLRGLMIFMGVVAAIAAFGSAHALTRSIGFVVFCYFAILYVWFANR